MNDPLKARLEKIRKLSDSANRRANMYSDMAKMDGKDTSTSLRALRKAPAPGKKIQKIGFLLIWIPEPTGITCAIGGPMVLAGRYMEKKYNSSTIVDVGKHTKDTFSSIKDFKNTVF